MGKFDNYDNNKSWKDFDKETLIGMLEDYTKNWLAHDGVWFQSIEDEQGLDAAVRIDGEAWKRFTPIEARRIKKRHSIPDNAGIEGLIKALSLRMYAQLIDQEILNQTPTEVTYRITNCKVQSTRIRKEMPLFPCKPVGIEEFTGFAKAIDERIKVEMITCPPDPYNGQHFCTWRFYIEEG